MERTRPRGRALLALLASAGLAVLGACSPAAQPTPTPVATETPAATPGTDGQASPPALNESIVVGRVEGVQRDQVTATTLSVFVLDAQDVGTRPNLVRDRVGSVITVEVPGEAGAGLARGDVVQLRVQMRAGPGQPAAFYGSRLEKIEAPRVLARPNASLVRGQVVSIVKPAGVAATQDVIYQVELLLQQASEVAGVANMLAGREGDVLTVLVRAPSPTLALGDVVEATVSFQGDERGAAYYARDLRVVAPAGGAGQPGRVSVRPNISLVTGTVATVAPYQAPTATGQGWVMEINLVEAEAVTTGFNLLAGKRDVLVQVYTQEALVGTLQAGTRVKAKVTLRPWQGALALVATEIEVSK